MPYNPQQNRINGLLGSLNLAAGQQVGLRFLTQIGASFTVEARTPAHFRQDLSLFDFALSEEEMGQLKALNKQPQFEGSVTGPNA